VQRRGPVWLAAHLGANPATIGRVLQATTSHSCATWTPSPGHVCEPLAPAAAATNAPTPASWSTWTSKSSAAFPTAAAGGCTAVRPARPSATVGSVTTRPCRHR
jgi:hypothetical protein